ncbi:517_t:CDS:2, partial [Funneliformis geosporum]
TIYFEFTNNPPENMATLPEVFNSIASLLAQILQYIGQELPDDYYNHVMQATNYGNSLGFVGFDNAIKTNILAGKMAGRFTPPNPFNNSSAQAFMKVLISDKFLSIDTPETYEKRIRPQAGGRVGISSFNEETLSHSSIQKNLLAE